MKHFKYNHKVWNTY